MARHEQDREDLLREATALVARVELNLGPSGDPVVIGFRRSGAASVFFGPTFVVQFNAAGEVRRAFADGRLLKAERRQLVALRRLRTGAEVQLVRQPLDQPSTAAFCEHVAQRLVVLRTAIAAGRYRLRGQVPHNGQVVDRIATWLAELPLPPTVAERPNAG